MREEIIAGLQNAVARGQTLEQAAQSFINAGYNPQEVKAAYQMLSSGASNVITNANMPSGPGVNVQQNIHPLNYGNRPQQLPQGYPQMQQPVQMQQSAAPSAPLNNPPEKKKGGGGAVVMIIMIIFAALILLGALGYLFYILYMK
jgi:hypothetical protein